MKAPVQQRARHVPGDPSKTATQPARVSHRAAPLAFGNLAVQAMLRGDPERAGLEIGRVDDPLERQADEAADHVARTTDPQIPLPAAPALSRQSTPCAIPAQADVAPASVHDVLRSPGRPLDAVTRTYFESRFGHEFAQVRVHADAAAQRSADDVDAQAYTVGRDVVFGAGGFAPDTDVGRHLLAHELAHVVQQDGAAMPHLLRAPRSTAQFGDIKPYNEQGRARWNGTVRLSEHEHIRAKINLWLQTFDPQTGTSPYGKAAYRRSSTLTIPKDMANIKTRMDMQLRDRLRAAQNSGVIDAALVRELDIEADIERTVRARDLAIDERRRAGLSTTDLESITTEGITRTAHYQQGELFEVGKSQRSPITDAEDVELESALDPLSPEMEADAGGEMDRAPAPEAPDVDRAGGTTPAVETTAEHMVDASDSAMPGGDAVEHGISSGEIHAPTSTPPVSTGASSPRSTAGQRALGAAGKTADVAGLVAAGGDIIKKLYERDYAGAARTAGLTGGGLALGEAAGPLYLAYATIQGYDDEVKRDANLAGSRVEEAIGEGSTVGRLAGAAVAANVATTEAAYKGIKAPWESQYTDDVKERSTHAGEEVEQWIGEGSTVGRVAGAIISSATATSEVAFKGTFGVVGEGIGEGLAAGYLWLSGQRPDDYEVPEYYEQYAANAGKLNRARSHLAQLTAAQPDSSATAMAAGFLKRIAELEAINSDYRQRKTWTYWLGAQASVVEQQVALLR